jgi:hypothetical protein
MRQLYLDGLDMAPEEDLFSEGEESQPREGAQESELPNPVKTVGKTGIWARLCSYFKGEKERGRNVRVKILFDRGSKHNLPSFESDEYVHFVKYIPLGTKENREEQEVFRRRRKLGVIEVLDEAYGNLKDYSWPLHVSLLEKGFDFYLAQVGNLPERRLTSHERFLREIEARQSTEKLTIPAKKEVLRKYFSKYRPGKKMDLDRPGHYNRARRVEKRYDIEVEKAEEERRTR